MSPLLRVFIRLAIVFAVIFFALQPFNWFCQITQKCRPFYFSYYLPKQEGRLPIRVNLEITNYRQNLELAAINPELTTFSNRINKVTYRAKNTSKKLIRFRTKLHIEPETIAKYVKRYQCLCMQEYRLKPGEEIDLPMEFLIDAKIENDDFLDEDKALDATIKIRYEVK
jgi:cytochrome c oxidase assembly protein Cox11